MKNSQNNLMNFVKSLKTFFFSFLYECEIFKFNCIFQLITMSFLRYRDTYSDCVNKAFLLFSSNLIMYFEDYVFIFLPHSLIKVLALHTPRLEHF